MKRVTLAEKLSVPCPKCGAGVGKSCDRAASVPHLERRQAFLFKKRVEEQQRNAEAARPEVYIARFGE